MSSMLATAESAATSGPQLAVTSPSGTNQFHGRAFEYVRNNIFDAQEPLPITANLVQPPFHLNQLGGSLGGSIIRDKTFFFVAYEGYRQILGQTLLGFVPGDWFRTQVKAESPALIPVLNHILKGRSDSGMFRVDHRFSDKTTMFVRANIDEAASTAPLASSGEYLQQLTSSLVNSAIELLHVFSPTLLNEVKFGFNQSTADTTNINQTGELYSFAVSGFTTLNNNKVRTGVGNSFSGIDNVTWIKGRHAVKTGVEIRRIQLNQGNTASGTVSFASSAAFAANQASKATLTGALPVNGLRKTQYYGYLQDELCPMATPQISGRTLCPAFRSLHLAAPPPTNGSIRQHLPYRPLEHLAMLRGMRPGDQVPGRLTWGLESSSR